MGWLFKIEERDDEYDDKLIEIQLLKARIERLRNRLFPDRRKPKQRNEEVQELRHDVEEVRKKQTEQERRNAEMDELKAKLLGRMK